MKFSIGQEVVHQKKFEATIVGLSQNLKQQYYVITADYGWSLLPNDSTIAKGHIMQPDQRFQFAEAKDLVDKHTQDLLNKLPLE